MPLTIQTNIVGSIETTRFKSVIVPLNISLPFFSSYESLTCVKKLSKKEAFVNSSRFEYVVAEQFKNLYHQTGGDLDPIVYRSDINFH